MLIDGAHALMQLPFNINALGASYIVCNCHKWLCGARGSALLWVRRELQPSIRPLIVSHGSGCGFLSDFIWDGEELKGGVGDVDGVLQFRCRRPHACFLHLLSTTTTIVIIVVAINSITPAIL